MRPTVLGYRPKVPAAAVECPDPQAALKLARDLDAFCATVDVAIGVNIIAPEGEAFGGTRIRAAAEATGFKLEPDGVFHYRAGARQTLFTLDNHEPAPFLPESIKGLTTSGITLLLDVPRVANGGEVLARMFDVAEGLAGAPPGGVGGENRAGMREAGGGGRNEAVGVGPWGGGGGGGAGGGGGQGDGAGAGRGGSPPKGGRGQARRSVGKKNAVVEGHKRAI